MHSYLSNRTRHLPGSCDYCRRKKSDSTQQPDGICSNCLKAEVDCTRLVRAILADPENYTVPDDPAVIRKMLFDLSRHISSLESQKARWRHISEDTSATHEPSILSDSGDNSSENDEAAVEMLASSIQDLTLNDSNSPPRHFGVQSNLVMMRTAEDIREKVVGHEVLQLKERRPEFWTTYPWQIEPEPPRAPLIFPEDDLLQSLISLYFLRFHYWFPFLHRPTFERAISDRLHLKDRGFGIVVLGVCAIGSRFSQDPRNLAEGISTAHSLGWRWFRQILHLETSEPPTLYDLQHCCLAVIYYMGTSLFHSTWRITGIGIRIAQEMGVHRKKKGQPRTVHNELWRRSFWVLLNLDVCMCRYLGRPRATTCNDYDLEMMCDCDDEYWENEDPTLAFIQPPSLPSRMSFFNHWTKLMEIEGLAHSVLYPVNKMHLYKEMGAAGSNWDQKAVTELESTLNQWLSGIPEHLQWSANKEDDVFLCQSACLHIMYNYTLIQIHKKFIPGPNQSSTLNFPSLSICTRAARACVALLETLKRVDFQFLAHLISPFYTAGIVLLLSIWRDKQSAVPPDVSRDVRDVHQCMQLISEYEQRCAIPLWLKPGAESHFLESL
ncbi:hypothetical protein BT96DRAFT_812991 [Gymnopus androsaceus JB14]|uniref:Xylanolytic transcriptional activator regulatory domain-containing protein n=1 Tax=Gymnopus androsaceus JB14 TaxID=1447944 RepID=A0A6A4I803_9AGAR|nr:hypothetical protein BT96DRAFT_812991 [Gymnopus androsaceus JB14]